MSSANSYLAHYRATLVLAMPVVISQAGQMLTGIVDNMMIGHVDTVSLAASSFSNAIFHIVMVGGMGFAAGLTPLVGAAYGERQYGKVGALLRHSIVVNGFSTMMLLVVLLFLGNYLDRFGQDPEVVEAAGSYYRIITFSLLPLMLFFTCKQFAEGVESTRPAMFITLLGNLLNIGLNYLLIYGHWGFPALGLDGAGIATLISRVVMGLLFVGYVLKAPYFRPFLVSFFERAAGGAFLQKQRMAELFRISIMISLQYLVEVSAFAVGSLFVGMIGKEPLAAHQIVLSLASLSFMMASGIGTGVMIRVSNYKGAGQHQSMTLAGRSGLHLVIAFELICAALFVLGRYVAPGWHTPDQAVIDIAAQLMILAALFQLSDGIQVVVLSALRGLADVRIPTAVAVVSYWAIAVPVGYYMAFQTTLAEQGIWVGFLIGLSLVSLFGVARFEFLARRKAAIAVG